MDSLAALQAELDSAVDESNAEWAALHRDLRQLRRENQQLSTQADTPITANVTLGTANADLHTAQTLRQHKLQREIDVLRERLERSYSKMLGDVFDQSICAVFRLLVMAVTACHGTWTQGIQQVEH